MQAQLAKLLFEIHKIQAINWIGAVKDIVVGLAALGAASIAYVGLTTWRRELKGKSEYQLAKELLMAAYKVREAFKLVRHPVTYSYEYPKDMTNPDGSLKGEKEFEGLAHVYSNRMTKLNEAFMDLERKHLEAQVEWGSKYQDIIRPLRKCQSDLHNEIELYLLNKKHPRSISIKADEKAEQRAIIFYSGGKKDIFSSSINEAVGKFEEWLRPHVDGK